MNKFEEMFRKANELRWKAIELDSAGLHALASLTMEEFQREVRRTDEAAAAAARRAARPRVRFSLTLELGGGSTR